MQPGHPRLYYENIIATTTGMENLRKYVAQEAQSYVAPAAKEVASALKPGDRAPSSANLPFPTGKPTIVVFLRHCGCPCKSHL